MDSAGEAAPAAAEASPKPAADGAEGAAAGPEKVHSGWMEKRGENAGSSFKKRWFDITRHPNGAAEMTYMEKEGGKVKGAVNLSTWCEFKLIFTCLAPVL